MDDKGLSTVRVGGVGRDDEVGKCGGGASGCDRVLCGGEDKVIK